MKYECLGCKRKSKTPYCSWVCEHPPPFPYRELSETIIPNQHQWKKKKKKKKTVKKQTRNCSVCRKELHEDDLRYCSDECRQEIIKRVEVRND